MRFLTIVFLLVFGSRSQAQNSLFRAGDVVALVGGEDMLAASESGELELCITTALPDFYLKFRNFAKEGDTLFAQRREVNFPTLEVQLEKAGATVVLCQFGKMECFAESQTVEEV